MLIALGYTLFLIGVVLLILAPIQASQNKRRTEETPAWVTEVRKRYVRRRGTTYRIDFEYTVNGEKQVLKNVRWELEPSEPKYTICYNPKKPKDAHIKEFRSPSNPKIYAIAGAISTVISTILIAAGSLK